MDARIGLASLKRTEGATTDFAVSGPFGQDTAVGLITIPADRVVTAAGQLSSVGDGVLVTGRVEAQLDAQCARCLTDFSYPASAEFEELYVYPEQAERYADEDVWFVESGEIDLAPIIHDALILDQPPIVLCQPDCRGLCPDCGANLNDQPDHHHGSSSPA